MKRCIALLGCGILLSCVTAAAQTTQGSQPTKSEKVVHEGKLLDDWTKALNDDDSETRLRAARALVAIGAPAFPSLSEALSDSRQPLWKYTVEALVRIGEPAVPALLAAIRMERSGDLRHNGGAAALQQLGAAAHPALRRALDDNDPDVRMSAAVALRLQMMGRGDEAATIGVLAHVVRKNKDGRVRMAAAEALGYSGLLAPASEAAVDALLPALNDPEDDVQGMVAVSLVNLDAWRGQDVVPALIKALKSTEAEGLLPSSAARALGALGPAAEPAIPALTETIRRGQPFIADHAAEALGKIGPAAVPALRELLSSSTGTVRAHAAKALGSAGASAEDTVPSLLESLKRDSPSVRAAAARALGEARASSDEVIAALTTALADKNRDVRNAAIRALGRIGSKARSAVPDLVKLLDELHSFEHAAVMRTLGAIGPGAKEAIPAMAAELAVGGIDAGKNLARMGPAAVPALINALKSKNPAVRQAAAWGLRYLGPDAHDAVPALAELVKTDEKASNFALQALGAIGPEAAPAVPAIVGVLRDGDEQLQYWALHALRRIGPGAREARDVLRSALGTGDVERRWEAATALFAIGEVDAALPIVLKALRGDNAYYSIAGIDLLITTGSKAANAATALAEVMHDDNAAGHLRILCAKALTAVAPEDERGVAFLRERTGNSESPLALFTLAELGKTDATVITRLKAGLQAEDPRIAIMYAGALARIKSERDAASRLLQEMLQEKDPKVRVSAALALASAGIADPVAVKVLAGELRKEVGSGNELDAINSLGKVMRASAEARQIIEEALHSESDTVRVAARALMSGRQK